MRKLLGAAADAAVGLGTVAAQTAGDAFDATKNVVEATAFTSFLETVADRCTPIAVPVQCIPTGPSIDAYRVEADLSALEAAMSANQFVRPQITVHAISDQLDRDVLTDRLIAAFEPILLAHEKRMSSVEQKKQRRLKQERSDAMWGAFEVGALGLEAALLGATALLGPIFWLMIAVGGIGVLMEVPSLALKVVKRSIGMTVYDCAEDEEIDQIRKELEAQRPLLKKMVAKSTIVVTPELATSH